MNNPLTLAVSGVYTLQLYAAVLAQRSTPFVSGIDIGGWPSFCVKWRNRLTMRRAIPRVSTRVDPLIR